MSGWIKICGVRDASTAAEAVRLGASAIGLNFFAKSPRCVTPTEAAEIVRRLWLEVSSTSPMPIGVFVNHTLDEIETVTAATGLMAVQLHGDESPEFVHALQRLHPDWTVFKAFRIGDSLQPVADFVAECQRLSVSLDGCFLDAHVAGSFGGTGQTAPWDVIARDYDRANWPLLILAGGLTPDNVADAIQSVRPWGVDTASGVESSPGVKDTTLLARFVAEARRAFALGQSNDDDELPTN